MDPSKLLQMRFSDLAWSHQAWLESLPVSDDVRVLLARVLGIVSLLLVVFIARFVNLYVYRALKARARPNSIGATFLKYQVINRQGSLLSAIVVIVGIPLVFLGDPRAIHMGMMAAYSYLTWVIFRMGSRALDVVGELHRDREFPLTSLVQAGKVTLAIMMAVVIASILFDKSPLLVLSGLGAITAVLLLVFKDALLGLVAGVQLSTNNMIRLGDWVELPDDSANGTVIDIALTTIKIQNFDKTVSCVPAYQLIAKPFINWRGMVDSGGRRIKRSISLDLQSIRFADAQLLSDLEKLELLRPVLESRNPEVKELNPTLPGDTSISGNGRHLTNAGLYRAYIEAYLESREDVFTKNFTFLVRHLQPTSTGLPIEVYVFARTTDWAQYEGIQADIFDHLIAILPAFGLMPFQTESDFAAQLPQGSLVKRPDVPGPMAVGG
jgi:miniconductance mechanosensitive channel